MKTFTVFCLFKILAFALWFIALLFSSCLAQATEHKTIVYVTHIRDGDTFDGLICDSFPVTVRLAGIDCPEKHQPYGLQASWLLDSLIRHSSLPVTVYWDKKDGFGRLIGTVFTNDTISINTKLIVAGLAWCYTEYAKSNSECPRIEDAARRAHKGLWADGKAIAPWDWRKQKKGAHNE